VMSTLVRRLSAVRLAALAICATPLVTGVAHSQSTAINFEGARMIRGDGSAPIEPSAIVVQNGRIVAAGRQAEVRAPAGATRVDVSGKTIIPALVNLHGHVGYQRGSTYEAANYTRENILDHLDRYAYYGVGTVVSMGTDAGEIPYQIRADQAAGRLGGTLLHHAGRGFALPNAGPGFAALRPAPYGVTSAAEARRDVAELASKNVDVVKIWVDDRNGTVPKLPPEIYEAIIDEAHKHQLKVVAHVYYLADAKALAKAGIDGFAHPVRDLEMDDELIALLKARNVFVMANLGLAERGIRPGKPAWLDEPFIRESVDAASLARVGEALEKRPPAAVERAAATYRNMERSIGRLSKAGVRVLLGSDSGVQDHFMGHSEHRELELMAAAGMSPADVLAAATGQAAAALGFDDVGVLSPGKRADLVILDANPLENITATRRISQVYLGGVAVDRAALRARFSQSR
jgi:imidazolonepropionase-like amidohydrolase